MSDKNKGNAAIKINNVKFTEHAQTKEGMLYYILNITVTNKMNEPYTEAFATPLATTEIFAQGGNKYNRDFPYLPDLNLQMLNPLEPLNPGKSVTGDIIFQVDKRGKDLKVTFDTGQSPIPNSYNHEEGKTLSFQLDKAI